MRPLRRLLLRAARKGAEPRHSSSSYCSCSASAAAAKKLLRAVGENAGADGEAGEAWASGGAAGVVGVAVVGVAVACARGGSSSAVVCYSSCSSCPRRRGGAVRQVRDQVRELRQGREARVAVEARLGRVVVLFARRGLGRRQRRRSRRRSRRRRSRHRSGRRPICWGSSRPRAAVLIGALHGSSVQSSSREGNRDRRAVPPSGGRGECGESTRFARFRLSAVRPFASSFGPFFPSFFSRSIDRTAGRALLPQPHRGGIILIAAGSGRAASLSESSKREREREKKRGKLCMKRPACERWGRFFFFSLSPSTLFSLVHKEKEKKNFFTRPPHPPPAPCGRSPKSRRWLSSPREP